MRVILVGSDRSARGTSVPDSPAQRRQEAYAQALGHIDDISFTLKDDDTKSVSSAVRAVHPTNSISRFLYIWDALRIAKKLEKPDLVSAQDPFEAGIAGYLIARHFGVPLHVQIHTDFLSPAYARHSLLNRIRLRISRFVLPRASGIRVVSERIKHSLKAKSYKLQAEPRVLPMFVDTTRVDEKSDSSLCERFAAWRTKVLVVARLEPEKNVALALEAFAEAAPGDACLIIVGSGSERHQLEKVVAERGFTRRVFFEGARDPAPYYTIADLVMVTSVYEGYGAVIIEARSRGIPVIATDVGIAKEAGAIVMAPENVSNALSAWFAERPPASRISYPFTAFDEYVQAYVEDMRATLSV